ncbi:hypothetical protein [Spirosoma pomorum]
MKTSHILLAIIVLITLMGMTATNVLLKQEYDKLDWSNPLQGFDKRMLPAARHWVIDGPVDEVIVEHGPQSEAYISPGRSNYQLKQQGDTMFVSYLVVKQKYMYAKNRETDKEETIELVIRTPDLESVRMKNGRLTIRKFTLDSLNVSLINGRLRTSGLTVTGNCALDISQCSKTILGTDQYASLQATVRDSSALQLSNTQVRTLAVDPSHKAEVELSGRALRWLKK